MNKTVRAVALALSTALSAPAFALDVEVRVTNLTNGIYFTPLLVAAHDAAFHLFRPGTPASDNLQAMAEGGDLSGLIADVAAAGGSYVENPAGDVLAPGASTTAVLEVEKEARNLSVVAMLLPTNDGFVGLDAMTLPRRPGVYTVYLYGYDAGTEANDELITGGGEPGTPGIPADPGGNSGTGGTGVAGPDQNPMVHIHRSVVGDTDPTGGPSDLDESIHRWLNPVAKVTVTVPRPNR
ncbi:MAG: spondin domain-containing protein [Pseudomonadota bacterium]|nr:spondin domain-containing protein [Pseudomonadota bacterium]